jgi:N-glycosylase/DNA lyase
VTTPKNQATTDTATIESVFLPVGFVDVEATLDGGQAFRWWPEQDGAYRGVVGRRVVTVTEADGGIVIKPADGKGAAGLTHSISDYMGQDQDFEGFRTRFADDPCLGPALRGYPGLRVLRQDPWECLFSFICSSTSNIPRIKMNIGAVAEKLGYSIGPETRDVTFPEPESVAEAGEQFLRDLGLGFRAKYLVPAAEVVASGHLNLADLREVSYSDARNALTELHGVGEKVADCVLAFSLDKPESFIVDRHIIRALHRWYGVPEKASLTYAADWARDYFGVHAALANQYMFHRERLARRAADWGGAHTGRALPEDGQ